MNIYETYKNLLDKYTSFKTISTDTSYKDEMQKCVDWLESLFEENKFATKIIKGYGNPIILGEYISDTNSDTCLIYGHYDVQPADKRDGWSSKPFELSKQNNKLVSRGAIDNKGQTLIHMVNIFEKIENDDLNYNIKFLLEGDEETGSANIDQFIKKYEQDLKSDFVLVSDGTLIDNKPTIEVGFRGTCNYKVNISTSHTDLHSGMYGGGLPSASEEITKLISTMIKNGKIIMKGLRPKDFTIDQNVSDAIKTLETDKVKIKSNSGVKKIFTDNFYRTIGLEPALTVTGLKSGYIKDGYQNIIPKDAEAKFNLRISVYQDINKAISIIKDHISNNIPDYVEWEIEFDSPVDAVMVNINNKFVNRAEKLLEKTYNDKVMKYFVGGTLPIIKLFKEKITPNILSIPLANSDSNMHGIDENFDIELVRKGLKFSEEFF